MNATEVNQLAKSIDHTLLKPDTRKAQIQSLCEEAKSYGFGAVCIPPCYVDLAAQSLSDTDVKVATVISFPFGADSTETKMRAIEQAAADGASEFDIVMNISKFLSEEHAYVAEELSILNQKVRKSSVSDSLVKVIVETAYLPDDDTKRLALQMVSQSGSDFIKTSTGFAPSGATLADVSLFKQEAPPGLHIKASGGLKTLKDAQSMIENGASRLGVSSSVAIMGEASQSKV